MSQAQQSNILAPSNNNVALAAEALANGKLVAFPTETVYGLGADARNDKAVASIFEAKGRPSFNPLIVHFSTIEEAQSCVHFTPIAVKLAAEFWPAENGFHRAFWSAAFPTSEG